MVELIERPARKWRPWWIAAVFVILALVVANPWWIVPFVIGSAVGGELRLIRGRRTAAAIAGAVALSLAFAAYWIASRQMALFRRAPVERVDAAYEALLTLENETKQDDGSWQQSWLLLEEATLAPTLSPELLRILQIDRAGDSWQVRRDQSGNYVLARESPIELEVRPFTSVTPLSLTWSWLGRSPGDGTRYLIRVTSGQARVRAPENTVARSTPAPARQQNVTGNRTEHVIPLSRLDQGIELEIVHPWLRNVFAIWLRQFSLWQTPKWFVGVCVGVVAAGLGDFVKRLIARIFAGREKKPAVGFHPDQQDSTAADQRSG